MPLLCVCIFKSLAQGGIIKCYLHFFTLFCRNKSKMAQFWLIKCRVYSALCVVFGKTLNALSVISLNTDFCSLSSLPPPLRHIYILFISLDICDRILERSSGKRQINSLYLCSLPFVIKVRFIRSLQGHLITVRFNILPRCELFR